MFGADGVASVRALGPHLLFFSLFFPSSSSSSSPSTAAPAQAVAPPPPSRRQTKAGLAYSRRCHMTNGGGSGRAGAEAGSLSPLIAHRSSFHPQLFSQSLRGSGFSLVFPVRPVAPPPSPCPSPSPTAFIVSDSSLFILALGEGRSVCVCAREFAKTTTAEESLNAARCFCVVCLCAVNECRRTHTHTQD